MHREIQTETPKLVNVGIQTSIFKVKYVRKSETSSPDKVIIIDDDSDEDTIPHRRDFVQKTSKPVNDQDKIHGILKTKKSVRFLANLFEEPVEKKEDITKKFKNSSSPTNISVSDRKRKFELDNNIEVPPKLKAKMAARRKSFESVRSLFENACDFDNLSMISNISTASTIINENIPRKAVDPTQLLQLARIVPKI